MANIDIKADKDNVLGYTLYRNASGDAEQINDILDAMGVSSSNPMGLFRVGNAIFVKAGENPLFFQYPRVLFWDFVDKEKDLHDYVVFRAFQALKSIVGNKKYCQTSDKMLFARMCGAISTKDILHTPYGLNEYHGSRKRMAKLREELMNTFNGVKFLTPPNCHGYYVTMRQDVTLEEMANDIVKQKELRAQKRYDADKDQSKAMEILKKAGIWTENNNQKQ